MDYRGFRIEFSEEKNLLLGETRGVCFESVIEAVEKGWVVDDLKHSSKKYAHQRILVIKREDYIYAVPYVINKVKKTIFLKTVYPSRVLTEKYLKRKTKR